MKDVRKSPEYQRWRREVKQRDENTCRICGVQRNLHIHHIKPLEKHPEFATELDNGLTLCGNCHTFLSGKEESINLQTVREAVTGQHDTQIAEQLENLNAKFCTYLEPLLKSGNCDTRNTAVYKLFVQLQIYPDSLPSFLPLIEHILNGENEADEEFAKQMTIEFLKSNSSGAASQILREYERRIETEAKRIYRVGEDAYLRGDYATALKELEPIAKQGHAGAQFRLGRMYSNGEGVVQDNIEAVKWYRKAAEQNYASAQYKLGWMYENGKGVVQDDNEAVKWYRKSAEQNYALSQNDLGRMYRNSKGVVQDDVEAVKWYRKAAEQGERYAQSNLGWMYENGKGVVQDDNEAVKWYRKSAEQNHALSQNDLGWMYENGRGVIQDDVKAVKWYRKAAEQGEKYAQYNLGWMYENGRGIAQDNVEAMKWYRKAAEQGHASAQSKLAK